MTEAKKLKLEQKREEINPPEFLNKSLFQNILRQDESDENLELMNLEILPGSKLWNNFSSIMFKAVVTYKSHGNEMTKPLIVKMMPTEDGFKKEWLCEMPLFEREIDVYTKVFPQMKEILLSIGDMNEIAPYFLYHSNDPKTLILEDMTRNGFEMHKGFCDFDNTIKIVEHLANFHALSYYIYDNKYDHPIDLTKYSCLTTEEVMKKMKIFYDGFDILSEEVKIWPGYEMYAEKIKSLKDTFTQDLLKAYQPHPGGLNVLCHGDFTLKNLMILKDGASVNSSLFLDFQTSFWASPAIDLFSLLYGIGNAECRKRRGEILLRYHEIFSDSLHLFQSIRKAPTMLELNIEMLRVGCLEILWIVCLLPFYCIDSSEIDVEKIFRDSSSNRLDDMRRMMYRNEAVIEVIKEVLPELHYKGIIQ